MTWNPKTINEQLNKDRKAALKEQGKAEFLTLPEGVTTIHVDCTVALREMDGDFGKRKVFRITSDGEEYDLPASYSLAAKILKTMTAEKTTNVQIIRAGEGKQTRYSVKKA